MDSPVLQELTIWMQRAHVDACLRAGQAQATHHGQAVFLTLPPYLFKSGITMSVK
jgi:hypothetical protein